MDIKNALPWWVKLWAKIILARLPVPYSFWRRAGLFRHGEMNRPERAIATFRSYYDRACHYAPLPPGFESLELGPGDSILSGLAATALGASTAWLSDAGRFASTDLAACRKTVALLREQGAQPADIESAKDLDDVLRLSRVRYLTEGTRSLSQIPSASIDFIWSQVVLEHVRRAELPHLLAELRRVIKPGGVCVHSIDFRDHLGGGLNNLRFSERRWESPFFADSGFYTNRLRPREMLALFTQAGFQVEILKETRWPHVPLKKNRMAAQFRHLPNEDFLVAEIELLARPQEKTA